MMDEKHLKDMAKERKRGVSPADKKKYVVELKENGGNLKEYGMKRAGY